MANGPDLSKMTMDDLKALARDVEKAIANAEREQIRKARAAAEAATGKFGLTLDDVVNGTRKPKGKAAASEPRFRNPDNPSQTWTGRGRQPGWFKTAMEKGKAPEDMVI